MIIGSFISINKPACGTGLEGKGTYLTEKRREQFRREQDRTEKPKEGTRTK